MSVTYEETVMFTPQVSQGTVGGLTLSFEKGIALLHVFHDKGDFDHLEITERTIRDLQCALDHIAQLVRTFNLANGALIRRDHMKGIGPLG